MAQDVQRQAGRSAVGTVALVATVLSAIALVVMLVGSVVEAEGFTDDPNDNSAFADWTWLTFSLGGLVALVSGVVAWVTGRRSGRAGDVRAGQTAIGYLVLALVVTAVFSALVG